MRKVAHFFPMQRADIDYRSISEKSGCPPRAPQAGLAVSRTPARAAPVSLCTAALVQDRKMAECLPSPRFHGQALANQATDEVPPPCTFKSASTGYSAYPGLPNRQ